MKSIRLRLRLNVLGWSHCDGIGMIVVLVANHVPGFDPSLHKPFDTMRRGRRHSDVRVAAALPKQLAVKDDAGVAGHGRLS